MIVMDVLLKAASIGVAVIIASAGCNIGQMYQLVNDKNVANRFSSDRPYSKYISRDNNDKILATNIPRGFTLEDVLEDLKTMKRPDLIKLFLASRSPSSTSTVTGEWNAILLENNGLVMTSVARELSNTFFGNGNLWNGKKFNKNGVGTNRFSSSKDKKNDKIYNHNFEWGLKKSTVFNGESLLLDYSDYQGPLSPWKSMKDEVRVLGKTKDGKLIMLGMGCMAWSGGMLNATPFCLFAKDEMI